MKTSLTTLAILLTVGHSYSHGQISKAAREGAVIEAGGLNGTAEFYAQNAGSNYDEYSMIEFSLSKADFEGTNITDITAASLTLTVNDRTFANAGPFTVFFTPDSKVDLGNYATMAFDANSDYGIDLGDFPTDPVAVGTSNFAYGPNEGEGEQVEVILDLSAFEPELIAAINSAEPFHLLIGALESDGTVATFSGVGNTYDPGDPMLNITAVSSSAADPEPPSYPSGFSASASFTTITVSWTDIPGAVGYVVQISETDSFPGVSDGTAPSDDLDLDDGSGQVVVNQGEGEVTFSNLDESTQYYFTIFPFSNLGTDTDYKTDGTPPEADVSTGESAGGSLLFTQYYEGSGNNKYLEITNVSDSEIDLTGIILTAWSNEAAEDWKTGTSTTDRITSLDGYTIRAGSTIVVANSAAASPIDPSAAMIPGSDFEGDVTVTFFNGNDSVVMFVGDSQDPSTIMDAISFTDAGNEGAETSFVRVSTDAGFDLTAGSNVTSFPSVWTAVDLSTVDSALPGDDEHLGSSDLGTPSPIVEFVEVSEVVSEGDGTFEITFRILNPDGESVDVDVVFDSGLSSADLSDIDSYSTATVSFPSSASHGDTQTVTVTLTDDSDLESSEFAIFALGNLLSSGNAALGSASQFTATIQDNDTPIPTIFLSELVDPADDASARYVEIYNPTASPVDLAAGQWYLSLYFNAGSTPNSEIALTGTIPAGGTYVVGAAGYAAAFGSAPDQENGNINMNGNDNVELRFGGGSSTGILVDVYGEAGVDGVGSARDYVDGRAVRLDSVADGTSTFDIAQWSILTEQNVADASPGSHPEAILSPPTGVSATPSGDTAIQTGFAPVSGNDVIVVFNTSGEFTSAAGSVPAVNDSFAGGTVIYVGSGVPPLQTGLVASTEYFYAFFSTDGTDYSVGVTASATTASVAGLIGEEDFSGDPAVQWVNQSGDGVDADYGWQVEDEEAKADGYDGPASQEHYLVSPALSFTDASNPVLEFDYGEAYEGPSLQILYSTDYSGSGVPAEGTDTWTPISFTFSEDLGNQDDEVSSYQGSVELPESLEGEATVYLAFLYTSDGSETGSRQWYLDNILVRSSSSDPVSEYLDSYGLTLADLNDDSGDNDGMPVIIEYLVDGDPDVPDAFRLEGMAYEEEGELPRLTIEFLSNRATEPAGVTIEVLGSNDLGVADPFVPVSFDFLAPTDNGDGTFTHRYRQVEPIGGVDAKDFLRLRVTYEAP
tara:strand:+ start:7971 stop:11651 length:3681 start_codon:yes stop_codon:yes gene_type:complete